MIARCVSRFLIAFFATLLVLTGWGQPAQATTRAVTYYHNDALGSPIAATNAAGALLWRESYRPYGERLNNAPAGGNNPLWYTGKRQDPETGLVYMGARYYNPMLGRFLSIDPIEPDENNLHSLNRYAYANNNPYKFVDPDGQAAETVIDVISLGLSIKAWRQDPSFVNALAVAYDGFATAIPVLPGGIGIIRQASSKGGEITQAVKQAADGGAARAGEGAKKIVIGENMERVREAAKKVGAETFEGKGMNENRAWIRSKLKDGYEVHDIGPDFSRRLDRKLQGKKPDSPFYGMERQETKNVPVAKSWERTGKFSGQSPLVD